MADIAGTSLSDKLKAMGNLPPGQQINATPGLNISAMGQPSLPQATAMNAQGQPSGPIYHNQGNTFLGGQPGTPGSQQVQASTPGAAQPQQAQLQLGGATPQPGAQQPYQPSAWDIALGRGKGGIFGPSSHYNQTDQPTNVTYDPRKMYGTNPNKPSETGQGGLGEFAFGKEGFSKQFPTLDPETIAAIRALQPEVQSQLMASLKKGGFGPIREATERRFAEQLPGLGERLNSLSGGSTKSTGGNALLAGAQAGLHSQLAGQEAEYNQRERQSLNDLFRTTAQPTFETSYIPRTEGAIENLAPDVIKTFIESLVAMYGKQAIATYFGFPVA